MKQKQLVSLILDFNQRDNAAAPEPSDAGTAISHRVRVGEGGDVVFVGVGSGPLRIVVESRREHIFLAKNEPWCVHEIDWNSVTPAGSPSVFEVGATCTKCGESGFASVVDEQFYWNDDEDR